MGDGNAHITLPQLWRRSRCYLSVSPGEGRAASISPDFFVRTPQPVGEAGGGLANASVGTLILISIAASSSTNCMGGGLYLSDRKGSRLANVVRFYPT